MLFEEHDNPFRSGFGTAPPLLAGRDGEQSELLTLLRQLQGGAGGPVSQTLAERAGKSPLLLIVDEAHEIDPEAAIELFSGCHVAARHRPKRPMLCW